MDALRTNLTRTFLTLLGVIVGVAAVIAVVAIARGGQAFVVREVEGLGSGMIWVEPDWAAQDDFTRVEFLDERDLTAVARLPGVEQVSPMVTAEVRVQGTGEVRAVSATGVSGDYADIRNLTLTAGRFFHETETSAAARVVVLAEELAEDLLGSSVAVGETLWVNGRPFVIIGVLQAATGLVADIGGGREVYVPYTALQRLTGRDEILALFVRPSPGADVARLLSDIDAAIVRNHGTGRFTVNSLDQVLEAIRNVTDVMTLVVASIAAVALMVGGIGIMNIMLVSVTERTREIGLRKAIGARRSDILAQFLIEAVVVSSLGGVLGILVGGSLVWLIGALTALPSLVTPGSILLAFGFSALVGVVFGVYPANKAARLDPIEALRYE